MWCMVHLHYRGPWEINQNYYDWSDVNFDWIHFNQQINNLFVVNCGGLLWRISWFNSKLELQFQVLKQRYWIVKHKKIRNRYAFHPFRSDRVFLFLLATGWYTTGSSRRAVRVLVERTRWWWTRGFTDSVIRLWIISDCTCTRLIYSTAHHH